MALELLAVVGIASLGVAGVAGSVSTGVAAGVAAASVLFAATIEATAAVTASVELTLKVLLAAVPSRLASVPSRATSIASDAALASDAATGGRPGGGGDAGGGASFAASTMASPPFGQNSHAALAPPAVEFLELVGAKGLALRRGCVPGVGRTALIRALLRDGRHDAATGGKTRIAAF